MRAQWRLVMVLVMLWPSIARAMPRTALVVGIASYHSLPLLRNPVADAKAIAAALQKSGFRVTTLINPDIDTLRGAVAALAGTTTGAPAALFYYAGHAVQYDNRDYLLATDSDPTSANELEDQGLDLTDVMLRLVGAKLRLLFIDACRDSPFSFTATSQRGLATLSVGSGTTLVFSAASEEVASDGEGAHSPFASALLAHMTTPGLELSPMLRAVSADLQTATVGHQHMTPSDNRTSDFFFVPLGGFRSEEAVSQPAGSTDVSGLLVQLEPFSGTRRLLELQDRLPELPKQAGLDAGQAQALLGDIPAPALRRYGLKILLPRMLRPIKAPDAARLLASFDGPARGDAAEVLLPCLGNPMSPRDLDEVVGDTPMPLRALLSDELQSGSSTASCPKPD